MRRVLLLTFLAVLCCSPVWPRQDLTSGVGEFIGRPQNPPARRPKQKQSAARAQSAPGASARRRETETEGTATDHAADAAGAGTNWDTFDDALWFGNEARDQNPPRYDTAERAYRLAAKLSSQDPRPYIGLGNIFFDQKRFEEAAIAYRTAVQLAEPYNARLMTEVRRRESIERAERRAGRRHPKHSTTRAIGVTSEEWRFFNASVEMLGQESAYLGSALLQQGRYAEAEAELRKATAKNQDNAEWWALLGAAQLAQHKYLSARRSLRSAVLLEPDNERYAALLSQVRRGAGR